MTWAVDAACPTPVKGSRAGERAPSPSTDSESVHFGHPEHLSRRIVGSLDAARLCASDPLCAEHHPAGESVTLHGAACHACLFVPETSCERGNRYLDRSVLVETLVPRDRASFAGS